MRHYFISKSFFLLFILLLGNTSVSSRHGNRRIKFIAVQHSLYNVLQLEQVGLKQGVFEKAVKGWEVLKRQNISRPNILSIIDLSQSCNAKRLYVIDMEKEILLFNTYVAHGRNSGQEFALSFSNTLNSFKSSLGFYLTAGTYNGAHGLSMRLKGMEQGINNIAEQRGIVMHGAAYVSESFIRQYGRLGRSQGCPAVTQQLCEPIINAIKGGSCLFMFYPDSAYFRLSALL